jgi:hypothetical protein
MFSVATNQTGFLPDEGKYTVECLRIEEAPDNGFGVGVRWVLALFEGSERVKNDSGYDYEFWQTTSPNMGPKARARQYVEAFLGRALDEGERINPDDLPGKKCTGMIIHEDSKTKVGVQNAKLVSVKPLSSSAPMAAPKPAPRPAAPQVSADASLEDVDRALVVTQLQKRASALMSLDETAGQAALDAVAQSDLSSAPVADLQSLSDAIQSQVRAALAAA